MLRLQDGRVLLGHEDGVSVWDDAAGVWRSMSAGLPLARVWGLAEGPTAALFAATDAGVHRSLDAARSWRLIGRPEQSAFGLAAHPQDPNRLLVHLAFERVYSSENALAENPTWTARWEGMRTDDEVMTLAFRPDGQRVFAGVAHGLYVSEDGGRSWRRVAPTLRNVSVFDIYMDPDNPNKMLAGTTRGLFKSEDGGETWRAWGDDLADVTVTALVALGSGEMLAAGTKYEGVWLSEDGGRSWVWMPESGTIHVRDLAVDAGGRLFAAADAGVWMWR